MNRRQEVYKTADKSRYIRIVMDDCIEGTVVWWVKRRAQPAPEAPESRSHDGTRGGTANGERE